MTKKWQWREMSVPLSSTHVDICQSWADCTKEEDKSLTDEYEPRLHPNFKFELVFKGFMVEISREFRSRKRDFIEEINRQLYPDAYNYRQYGGEV